MAVLYRFVSSRLVCVCVCVCVSCSRATRGRASAARPSRPRLPSKCRRPRPHPPSRAETSPPQSQVGGCCRSCRWLGSFPFSFLFSSKTRSTKSSAPPTFSTKGTGARSRSYLRRSALRGPRASLPHCRDSIRPTKKAKRPSRQQKAKEVEVVVLVIVELPAALREARLPTRPRRARPLEGYRGPRLTLPVAVVSPPSRPSAQSWLEPRQRTRGARCSMGPKKRALRLIQARGS